jgi:hypothetical protein
MRGLEGTLTGVLVDAWVAKGYPVAAMIKAAWAIKSAPQTTFRLVAGDRNLPVQVFDVNPFPHPESTTSMPVVNLTLGFAQVGELPFTVAF